MNHGLATARVDLSVRCRCGHFELAARDVSPAVASRVICHCDGCRKFAERLAPELLDEHGGTERFQVTPACLEIVSGQDALGCMQQSRKGALRWVALCCRTPIGLTLSSHRVPFVGLDVRRIDVDALPSQLMDVIGPVRARVNGDFPRGERALLQADARSLFGMLVHLMPLTWKWWRRGDQRRSPFFSLPTGEPVVEVEKLFSEHALRLRSSGCQ